MSAKGRTEASSLLGKGNENSILASECYSE